MSDTEHSRVSAEDVERGAMKMYTRHAMRFWSGVFPAWPELSEAEKKPWYEDARAVLSSIEAVPKAKLADCEMALGLCERHDAEMYARAESAEARCESYRTVLEEAGRVADGLGYGTADCAEDERPFTAREIRALERPLTKAVRAALAVPQEGPCATCKGTGRIDQAVSENWRTAANGIACPDCQEGKPR